jgi:hypothetical protein
MREFYNADGRVSTGSQLVSLLDIHVSLAIDLESTGDDDERQSLPSSSQKSTPDGSPERPKDDKAKPN